MRVLGLAIVLALSSPLPAFADEYVQGYFRKDGTYVQPHVRSSPNANRWDNRSSQTMGGSKRDEFDGAYNKSNRSYSYGDNDGDGYLNSYDPVPESSCNNPYGC